MRVSRLDIVVVEDDENTLNSTIVKILDSLGRIDEGASDDRLGELITCIYTGHQRLPNLRFPMAKIVTTVSADDIVERCLAADVVLLDLKMPRIRYGRAPLGEQGREEGLRLAEMISERSLLSKSKPELLVMTAFDEWRLLQSSKDAGVEAYLLKNPGPEQRTVQRDLLELRLHRKLAERRAERPSAKPDKGAAVQPLERIVGTAPVILRTKALLPQVAQHDLDVRITGGPGTGKRLVAQVIHQLSPRSERQFSVADAGGLRSADFTGGGTLYLSGLQGCGVRAQERVLNLLLERDSQRTTRRDARESDVRLVCSANDELEFRRAVRADLFFRVNSLNIELPLLRDRPEDLELLTHHLVAQIDAELRSETPTRIEPEVLRRLKKHDWPGNVRELEEVLRQTCSAHQRAR